MAEILKVTKRSVDRWRADAKKPKKKKTGRLPGRPSKLSGKQVKRLEKVLDKGAYAFGYMRELLDPGLDCSGDLEIIWRSL